MRYERVNIDDIDTSSDDDDYGDLFANERSRITSNGRRSKMMPARKGRYLTSMHLKPFLIEKFSLIRNQN